MPPSTTLPSSERGHWYIWQSALQCLSLPLFLIIWWIRVLDLNPSFLPLPSPLCIPDSSHCLIVSSHRDSWSSSFLIFASTLLNVSFCSIGRWYKIKGQHWTERWGEAKKKRGWGKVRGRGTSLPPIVFTNGLSSKVTLSWVICLCF